MALLAMLEFQIDATVPYTSNRDNRDGGSCQRLRNVVVTRLKFARVGAGRLPDSIMPSLFRFLVFVGLIGGIGYVAVFSLANFVKYQPREIVVTIPPDKFLKKP